MKQKFVMFIRFIKFAKFILLTFARRGGVRSAQCVSDRYTKFFQYLHRSFPPIYPAKRDVGIQRRHAPLFYMGSPRSRGLY